MRTFVAIIAFACCAAHAWSDGPPRRELASGQQAYQKQDFPAAAEHFDKAAQGAAATGLDPAVPYFDQGNALYREGKYAEAFDAFAHAGRTTDLQLQAKALYNAGTCRLAQIDAALKAGQGQYVEQYLADAQKLFEQAVLLDPRDQQAKVNCEIALARRAVLVSGIDYLKQVLAQAEAQVGRYDFQAAYATLSGAQPKLGIVLALQRPETKRFHDMLTRCGQVLGIIQQTAAPAEGEAPPPSPGGPQ